MSGTWGNDPLVAPAASARPAATGQGWGDDPIVGAQNFRFSDKAIQNALARPGSHTVLMAPQAYLALAPDLPTGGKADKKGKALQASIDSGDNINEVPGLEVVIDKDGHARVTDQDGRHRAQAALDAGLTQIPVVVQGFGSGKPITSLTGMRAGAVPIPFDFKPYPAPISRETLPGKLAPQQKPTPNMLDRFSMGVNDPIEGAVQLAAHGAAALARPFGIDNPIAQFIDRNVATPIDQDIAHEEGRYQEGRRAASGGQDPGTDYARLVGNIASPVNYVPLSAVSRLGTGTRLAARAEPVITKLVRGLARNVVTGGTAGATIAALNPVTGGDFWTDKTKQVAGGLVGGTFVPPIFRAGANVVIRAGSAALAPVIRLLSTSRGPNATLSVAEQEIMRRLGQGGGPTAQDMLDLFGKTPHKPLTLMDVGSQPVNALAGRVARRPGAPGQIIGDFLGDRTDAQGLRLEGDVNKNVGRGSAYSTIDALQHSRANAASPLYTKAFAANPTIVSPVIDRILETPAGRNALKAASIKMQNDMSKMGAPDKEIAEQLRELGERVPKGGVASGLNLRSLDYVKRAFDDMIGAARRDGVDDDVRIFTGLKKDLVRALDEADVTARAGPNSTRPEGGLYRQARAAYSGPSQSIEALDFGKNALKPSTSSEEVAATFKDLNKNDKEFARMGLASALREMISRKDVGTNAARTLARNPAIQSRIRPFFDTDAAYQKFMNSVVAEDRMFRTATDVLGGSPTARRLAEDTDHGNAAMESAGDAVINFSHGNHIRGLTKLRDSLASLSQAADPEVAANIARILSTPLNQPGSHGLQLLRNFSVVAPGTRNYLSQAVSRAARGAAVPTGVVSGQAAQP